MKKKRIIEPEPMDFQEDHELESVSLDELERERLLELERERLLDLEEEEDMEDFYLPPEKSLKFE